MNQLNDQENGKSRWRERLCRLEEDLDELVELEAKRRREEAVISACTEKTCVPKQRSIFTCSCHVPYTCSKLPKTQPQAACEDIPRFLRNINSNLAKGTEAINKIVNFAGAAATRQLALDAPCTASVELNNAAQRKSNIVANEDVIAYKNWKKSVGSNNNIDNLFKELREEKDKKQRAENQVKIIKEDLKKCRSSVEQEYETKIEQLSQELKNTAGALEASEIELRKTQGDLEKQMITWKVKYGMLVQDLKDEKEKRKIGELEKLDKHNDLLLARSQLSAQTEENRNIQSVLCVEKTRNKQMELKVEEMQNQLVAKQKTADLCTSKIKQLVNVCDKLKDQLLVYRRKYDAGQRQVEHERIQVEKLTFRSKELQSRVESLEKQLNTTRAKLDENNEKHKDTVEALESHVKSTEDRLLKLIDINKKQEHLISAQNDSVDRKQQQLWVAFNEITRLHQHLQSCTPPDNDPLYQDLDKIIDQLRKQNESEKQTVLIKDKIIEDQSETIDRLKKNVSTREQELCEVQKARSVAERELTIQRTTNEELADKLKRMQQRKEELKQQLQELESELEEFQFQSQSPCKDQQLLEKLEKQVFEHQKVWEIQATKLQKERDDAIQETRCVKQMQQQQVEEFEKELLSRRNIQAFLENIVREKDSKLTECEHKVVTLTEELKRRTSHYEQVTADLEAKLLRAADVWKNAVLQIKSRTLHV